MKDERTITTHKRSAAAPLAARVRVLGSAAEHRLSEGLCLLGSSAGNDIVIDDRSVSRRHAELALVPEGVRVTDLGSRNGTYFQGQRIERIVVAPGTQIRLGDVTVSLEPDHQDAGVELEFDGTSYEGLIGHSASMRRVFALLSRLEGSLLNVLVQGESGVGKELIARAIVRRSMLAGEPLITINCGALAPELVASELFGHRRGAFTSALEERAGAFEAADGGTLFLDEVGELPLTVQPMLLRALESGEVRRVGADRARRLKVRIIAATNRDLQQDVQAGRFREDLYYRLAVMVLRVPPLRERPEDIEPLARHFAAKLDVGPLDNALLARLQGRPWRGNARELRNVMGVWAAVGLLPEEGPRVDLLELGLAGEVDLTLPYAVQKERITERFTRLYLRELLRKVGGSRTEAAKLAGMDRGYLGRLVNKLGVQLPRSDERSD